MMKKTIIFLVAVTASLSAFSATYPGPEDQSGGKARDALIVTVDTDMGLDDARALLLLTASPSVRIAAVMTTGGSAAAAKGADNAIGLIEYAGSGDVTVLRGMTPPGLDPPAWREHAESLGGHPFPPPRRLSQRPLGEALREGWEIPGDTWLALGPLTTMAALDGLAPGSLASVKVWLPAHIDGKTVSGWNISSDPASALAVLTSAESAFIVDTSGGFDGPRILRGVEGDSPAARWIAGTTGGNGGSHAFLFDEIAAAALASPGIFSVSKELYEAAGIQDGGIRLKPSEKGNIRIVRLIDAAALEPALHSAWEGGIEGHIHSHAAAVDPLALMKQFHGHLGPYVVIGYRMGMVALERTGSSGHFEIAAEVHSVLRPPRSCLIDGVQLGSGCTLGKRNIAIFDEAGPPFAAFTTGDGKVVTVRLLPSIPAMIKASTDSIGVEATGAAVWEMDEGSLFEVIAGH